MKKLLRYMPMVIVLFVLAAGACSQQEEPPVTRVIIQKNEGPAASPITQAPVTERDFRNIIVNVAKDNIPAVVHIAVTQSQEVVNPFFRFEGDPFFRRFFDFPQAPKKFKRETKGIGTGMIIDEDGFILTNNHVVAGATEIEVILSDGTRYKASVVGADPKTDLAVIRVSADKKLPHVTFGDSDRVEVGEWVVAIGHPRGFDQTVTQGIISAKHRRGITDPTSYEDFLQTDAAINPGNSGGPLLNLDGRVIGVNSVIISQSGGNEGIGFAIPSNMAMFIAKSIMDKGRVERGWLGISLQDVPAGKLEELKLDRLYGAYVADVIKEGPAYRAGIRAGDVILSMNGKEVKDAGFMRNLVAAAPLGSNVSIELMRRGEKLAVTARIGSPDDAARIMAASLRERLGVDVRPLDAKEFEKYGLEQGKGVAVKWLDPQGSMAKAGFEIDDVILAMNNQPVESVEDFASMASVLPSNQQVVFYVMDHRSGRSGQVKVTIQ